VCVCVCVGMKRRKKGEQSGIVLSPFIRTQRKAGQPSMGRREQERCVCKKNKGTPLHKEHSGVATNK